MKKELSKITKIELRQIWGHEALDFTRWLSKEENLHLLSEAVEMDIKLIQTEASVGRYNVDILAEEESTGHKIIIENQLEDTNHDHLGKLLTYASGYDAKTMIWIVKNAREEHIKAIEWLNENTDDSLNFFLINIEVWKIDDSNPAPRFEVVVRPNEWAKTIRSTTGSGELTNTKLLQLNLWARFKDYCQLNYPSLRLQKPGPQHWYNFTIGSTLAHIALLVNTKDSYVGIELLAGDQEFYKYLENYKEEIEKQIGHKLEWSLRNKTGNIRLKLNIDDALNEKNDSKSFEWLASNINLFKKVFTSYIKEYSKEN
jgi:hypothetical protein